MSIKIWKKFSRFFMLPLRLCFADSNGILKYNFCLIPWAVQGILPKKSKNDHFFNLKKSDQTKSFYAQIFFIVMTLSSHLKLRSFFLKLRSEFYLIQKMVIFAKIPRTAQGISQKSCFNIPLESSKHEL